MTTCYCAKWTFLLQSRWAKVKVLYIVTRYTPFLLFAGRIFRAFRAPAHTTPAMN
jgi:hypothetical protein